MKKTRKPWTNKCSGCRKAVIVSSATPLGKWSFPISFFHCLAHLLYPIKVCASFFTLSSHHLSRVPSLPYTLLPPSPISATLSFLFLTFLYLFLSFAIKDIGYANQSGIQLKSLSLCLKSIQTSTFFFFSSLYPQ